MYKNRKQNFQHLAQLIEDIESTFLYASNSFQCLQQEVNEYTSLNPEELTACDCRVREQDSKTLIKVLQEHRKMTEELKELREMIVCEVKNYNHPTLLDRLEVDIKWKITKLLDNLLHEELQVDQYQIKLFRQIESKIAKSE
ncbi:hypothetical protein CDAR_391551 [Caerostris darwini]|uniref:Uncharacterized protein n=1 Tax=Caerostris darwini TaxID=1538125 RepID=A0AAV4VT55_9ARAC|nr:hypothetical protein CDAR_309471 [Caerostris darwini]GIY72799.1 hypothetical protein CDAR_391551 [Caerostris darwini]